MHFVPFPGPSSSGKQVLGKCTVPGRPCILITSPVLALWFPGYAAREPSQVCHVSPLASWSQAATLLADVNHPGSREDLVSNWEPAHSLVEEPSLGPRLPFAFWLWLLPTCLSASSWGRGPVCSQLALLWYSLNPLFCEWARLCLRLELFAGKFSLSLFSLSGYPTVWVAISLLAPSDCPQGIQARSLP